MKLKQITSFARLFLNLLKKDLLVYFKQSYVDSLLDNMIWTGTFIFIMSYVLPQIGLSSAYGAFFAVSMIVSVGFWDSWATTTQFISDLDGTCTVEYYLTLPLPSALFFIKQITYFAIRAGALSLGIIPLVKIILWKQFDFSQIALGKTAAIFVAAIFFCAAMSLLMASMVKNINNLGRVGIRTLFPMFSLGGTQYSWLTMYTISPLLAYFSLANPLLYATEGMHAAMLGQAGYLPFWLCIIIVPLFTIIISTWSIRRMKRRLDCV